MNLEFVIQNILPYNNLKIILPWNKRFSYSLEYRQCSN